MQKFFVSRQFLLYKNIIVFFYNMHNNGSDNFTLTVNQVSHFTNLHFLIEKKTERYFVYNLIINRTAVHLLKYG